MHRLKGQGQPPAPLATDGRALKELLWCGGEGSAALRPDGSFQQKKLACKLVEGGECEKQLLGRARQCQRALGEKQACRQEVEARARRCKASVRWDEHEALGTRGRVAIIAPAFLPRASVRRARVPAGTAHAASRRDTTSTLARFGEEGVGQCPHLPGPLAPACMLLWTAHLCCAGGRAARQEGAAGI
ncbi:uncharacterized protein LOC109284020 [Alligator mississippiensis]|uniref:uncharacterized protein LOC109284020 n=1 Tax=Alligator mississippiensis TaxID=8496 RepID=UPI0009074823|nr:uncharacterized protein LOC109284020 [Alligator mississippiensis]